MGLCVRVPAASVADFAPTSRSTALSTAALTTAWSAAVSLAEPVATKPTALIALTTPASAPRPRLYGGVASPGWYWGALQLRDRQRVHAGRLDAKRARERGARRVPKRHRRSAGDHLALATAAALASATAAALATAPAPTRSVQHV